MASNVVEKKKRYEGHELLDEFLLNQVAKEVNVFKLSLLAKDLGIPQTEYNKITSPNTFTKDEQIQRVSKLFGLRRILTQMSNVEKHAFFERAYCIINKYDWLDSIVILRQGNVMFSQASACCSFIPGGNKRDVVRGVCGEWDGDRV